MAEFSRLMNFMLVLAAFFVLFGAVFFTAAISLFQKAWRKEQWLEENYPALPEK
jgi:hypothetical protein